MDLGLDAEREMMSDVIRPSEEHGLREEQVGFQNEKGGHLEIHLHRDLGILGHSWAPASPL